jgi:hypothetical protein
MAAVDAPTTIIDSNVTFTEKPIEDRALGVGTSVCVGEVIDRVREEGGVMEATTPGLFMLPEGDDKQYRTFLEMLRDQPQPPDPVFKDGDVLPTFEDVGFPLDKMEEYEAEFEKMYLDMFSRTSEMGVMGAGDFEARLKALQNELSNSKVENTNGGGIGLVPTGEPPVYSSQRPSTPLYPFVSTTCTGAFVPPPEEGGDASDSKTANERSGTPVDA